MSDNKSLDYEQGWCDAILWMAKLLRASADMVEGNTYSDFQRHSDGEMFKAISKTGQPFYASKLRGLASLLESNIKH